MMEKTTFKIAVKFSQPIPREPLQPIEYMDVEGYTIGNWGIVDIAEDDSWLIYHTQKGLRLSLLYFHKDNAIKALELAAKIFGENHDGEPAPENNKLLYEWETEAKKLAARECLYDDD